MNKLKNYSTNFKNSFTIRMLHYSYSWRHYLLWNQKSYRKKFKLALFKGNSITEKRNSVNETIIIIMEKVIENFKCCKSIDTVCNIKDIVYYPQALLNSLNPANLRLHELKLKVSSSIRLLWNLSNPRMCNGIRLLINKLQDNVIVAIILTVPATRTFCRSRWYPQICL